jgi:hypothetical protein
VPGRLWFSGPALYLGPYDDVGVGLPGSTEFARRHTGEGNALIVRLVLTSVALLIVPTRGSIEPISTPCDIATIAGHPRRPYGKRPHHHPPGRQAASFIVQTDDRLVAVLQALGAIVAEVI